MAHGAPPVLPLAALLLLCTLGVAHAQASAPDVTVVINVVYEFATQKDWLAATARASTSPTLATTISQSDAAGIGEAFQDVLPKSVTSQGITSYQNQLTFVEPFDVVFTAAQWAQSYTYISRQLQRLATDPSTYFTASQDLLTSLNVQSLSVKAATVPDPPATGTPPPARSPPPRAPPPGAPPPPDAPAPPDASPPRPPPPATPPPAPDAPPPAPRPPPPAPLPRPSPAAPSPSPSPAGTPTDAQPSPTPSPTPPPPPAPSPTDTQPSPSPSPSPPSGAQRGSPTGGSSSIVDGTSGRTASPAAGASTTSPPATSTSSNSAAIIVAAVVPTALVLALAGVVFVLWRRRYRSQLLQELIAPHAMAGATDSMVAGEPSKSVQLEVSQSVSVMVPPPTQQ